MHNYLPSEQSKLQFISGKILDVFYEEFIKFIPPYILKREEEKRKKLENSSKNVNNFQQKKRPSMQHGISKLNQSFVDLQHQSSGKKDQQV